MPAVLFDRRLYLESKSEVIFVPRYKRHFGMVPSAESLGTGESLRRPSVRSSKGWRVRQPSEQPGPTGGPSRLERINHWIRIVLGILILTVFIVGMIAYYFKYR